MANSQAGSELQPRSLGHLIVSVLIALAVALVLLVTVILPAEYGIDPLGAGRALGLDVMSGQGTRTIEIVDVIGGNEEYRNVEIPDFGQPIPLPNPGVHQAQAGPPGAQTLQITVGPEEETEIKTVLSEGKVILYSWSVDRGDIYSDFHGHEPGVSSEYWVRYREHQEGTGGDGSLVAPFAGEHGWYWLNYNDFPVVITLNVTGYYDDIIDYGIL